MKLKGFILALGLIVISFAANAQSSVYFDRNNGAIGLAYGNPYVSATAYRTAISYGALYPVEVIKVNAKGYGAIVLGTNRYGGRVIGAAAGYSTLEAALHYANMGAIYNGAVYGSVRGYTTWYDAYVKY
jgi:hypothetical protein